MRMLKLIQIFNFIIVLISGVVLRSCTVLFKFLEDEINDENNEDDNSSGDEN